MYKKHKVSVDYNNDPLEPVVDDDDDDDSDSSSDVSDIISSNNDDDEEDDNRNVIVSKVEDTTNITTAAVVNLGPPPISVLSQASRILSAVKLSDFDVVTTTTTTTPSFDLKQLPIAKPAAINNSTAHTTTTPLFSLPSTFKFTEPPASVVPTAVLKQQPLTRSVVAPKPKIATRKKTGGVSLLSPPPAASFIMQQQEVVMPTQQQSINAVDDHLTAKSNFNFQLHPTTSSLPSPPDLLRVPLLSSATTTMIEKREALKSKFSEKAEAAATKMVAKWRRDVQEATQRHLCEIEKMEKGVDLTLEQRQSLQRTRQLIESSAQSVEDVPASVTHTLLDSLLQFHLAQDNHNINFDPLLQSLLDWFEADFGPTINVILEKNVQLMNTLQLQMVSHCSRRCITTTTNMTTIAPAALPQHHNNKANDELPLPTTTTTTVKNNKNEDDDGEKVAIEGNNRVCKVGGRRRNNSKIDFTTVILPDGRFNFYFIIPATGILGIFFTLLFFTFFYSFAMVNNHNQQQHPPLLMDSF